jgi:rhamnosyltransferase
MADDAVQRLCAIVTAYRPDDAFASRFAPIVATCRSIIVVDNTPGGHPFADLGAPFVVLQDGRNKGLGKALNLGIARARELGCDAVVLFDQDSRPSSSLVTGLLAALDRGDPARSVVAPTHLDDQNAVATPAPARPTRGGLRPTTCLPTSGMLFRIEAWPSSPHFSEELFLDLVDFDWCWRMREVGWRFYRVSDVPMLHRLGLAERKLFGLTFHVPAPYRHYFQFRDTLRVTPRAYVPLYSKIRLLGILPLKLLAYPWLLDRGVERLRWMLLGIADAWRGRGGAGAAAARLGVEGCA